MTRQAYTTTSVAPAQILLGAAIAVALVVVNEVIGAPLWTAILSAVLIVVATIHIATVRLSIGHGRIVLGQGPWPQHGRKIHADTVTAAASVHLTRAQAFGIGMPLRRRTTRMSIRPGPALTLTLDDGEHIVITTPDPDAAVQLLTTTSKETP